MHEPTGIIPFISQSDIDAFSNRVPTLFTPTAKAEQRFWDFFTSNIRNRNTRGAYYRVACRFSAWCEASTLTHLARVKPITVARYIEQMLENEPGSRAYAKPSVKQHLAALRALFDWMVVGQIIKTNPAHAVRGPNYSQKRGKTIPVSQEEVRTLITSIDTSTLIGLRDRALIATLFNSLCRISAAVSMRVEDYFSHGRASYMRLQEKGGKEHVVPANHVLELHMDAYINGAGIASDPKGPLFRTSSRWSDALAPRAISRTCAYQMIRRRALEADIKAKIGNHSFRAGGITTYLENGGRLEVAQQLAAHESPRTTSLYDRRDDKIKRAEVERVAI